MSSNILDFIRKNEFNEFFIDLMVYCIDNNINFINKYNFPYDDIIEYIVIFKDVIKEMIKFIHENDDYSFDNFEYFMKNVKVDSFTINKDLNKDDIYKFHQCLISNLEKLLMIKNSIMESNNNVSSFKVNVDQVLSTDKIKNANFYTCQLEINKINCSKRKLYEFTSEELDIFLNELKEIYSNLK